MKTQHVNKNKKTQDICRIIFIVAIFNFALFIIYALILGGAAINGHETDGRYYLANHGIFTEVNYFVFIYSKIHAASLCITHPLGMIAILIYGITGGTKEEFWNFK